MNRFALAAPAALVLLCSMATSEEGACPSEQLLLSRQASAFGDDTSLLQLSLSAGRRGSDSKLGSKTDASSSNDYQDVEQKLTGETCSALKNQGAYFTVAVNVGTPEQTFNLVADTGSDALIIPDCRCVNAGFCEKLNNCFQAVNSTSFGLDVQMDADASGDSSAVGQQKDSVAIMGAKMNYGSGQIQVLVASENVRVAGIKTAMHNGVFLMEDRRSLKVHGDFEGILGLGLPHANPHDKKGVNIPAFMDSAAEVTKYAVCFNEWPNDGALRANMDALPNPMTNIGTVHWGLDLQGFSVGNATSPAIFCSPPSKNASQSTACGAIPDSGTTLMMGPSEHIRELYSHLCDQWPRCKKSAEKYKEKKDQAFHEFLYSCEDWMTDKDGVNEIPSIFLHLAGAEGKPQTVELSAWSFIVETTQEIYKVVTAKLFGVVPISAAVDTGKKKKICTASFGPQEYNTVQNGPVWILGAPMFYATTIAYDLGAKDQKAKIAFVEGPCTACNATASLLSSGSDTRPSSSQRHKNKPLRHLSGPIRDSGVDVNRPL